MIKACRIVLATLLIVSLSSCSFFQETPVNQLPNGLQPYLQEFKTNADGFKYNMTTIEGMPCLLIQSQTYAGEIVTSVTCDWSKWTGNK